MRATEAIRTAERAMRRHEDRLGAIAGGLLGGATAFFCFAALPGAAVLRLLFAILIGGAVGYATWRGFALLDAAGPRRLRLGSTRKAVAAAPVLRRADAHPDAPPRRPIFAGSDLGTPLDLIDPTATPAADDAVPRVPFPTFGGEPEDAELAPLEAAERDAQSTESSPNGPDDAESPPISVVSAPVGDEPTSPSENEPATPAAAAPARAGDFAAMIARVEAGLARKALALAGAEPNVTPMPREIRPIGGSLHAAVDKLQRRARGR